MSHHHDEHEVHACACTCAHGHSHGNNHENSRVMYWRAGISLTIALACEFVSIFSEASIVRYAIFVLSIIAILLCGFSTYKEGMRHAFRFKLNIDALMAVAVTGAFIIGEYAEAAMVMVLYEIAEMVEDSIAAKARNAIEKLLTLKATRAEVLEAAGIWQEVDVVDIAMDAIVRVRPGQHIALDGIVESGQSSVNQASVTGESMPVDKKAGDTLYAGTINQQGLLTYRVTAVSGHTVLDNIIRLVSEAQKARAPIERFVDKFAAIYTPAVFVLAIIIAVSLPFVAGVSWYEAVYKALVILVISCPCALVLSTPATIAAGLATAARSGILIKGGQFLEIAKRLRVIAMDKTGTITSGHPVVVDTIIHQTDIEKETILAWANAMASTSDHPVSLAIRAHLGTLSTLIPTQLQAIAGQGLKANIDSHEILFGNQALLTAHGIAIEFFADDIYRHESQGHTLTFLAHQTQVLALFAVADTVRETADEAVRAMTSRGLKTALLTGDNQLAAQTIGNAVGIDTVYAQLMPAEKQNIIEDLRKRYGMVAMVGDGINDAPALTCADIGIAMGRNSTDIAIESADVVLMNNNLTSISRLVDLSQMTGRVLWQNITIALGIKFAFMALAVAGLAAMWMAVIADTGVCLLVVANGLKMLKK